MQIGKHSAKWIYSATRYRIQAKFRRKLCRILDVTEDNCCTTRELLEWARDEQRARRSV